VHRPVAFPFEFAGLEELSHAGRRHAQDASGLRGAEECADRVDGSGSFSGNAGGRSSRLASLSASFDAIHESHPGGASQLDRLPGVNSLVLISHASSVA
jgi:hypothetical protein